MKILALFITTLFGFLLSTLVLAQDEPAKNEAGIVLVATGKVYAVNGGNERVLKGGSIFYEKDTIKTESDSATQLQFKDGALVSLSEKSIYLINQYHYQASTAEDKSFTELIKGMLRSVTGSIGKNNPQAYGVKTSALTLAVRGTDFRLYVDDNQHVWAAVSSGGIRISNSAGTLDLGKDVSFSYA